MLIEFKNVTKEYHPTKALADVSFSCSDGDVVGLIGPNGAGKTTLIRLAAWLTRPTSGAIFLDGGQVKRSSKNIFGLLSTGSYLYKCLYHAPVFCARGGHGGALHNQEAPDL